jgi:hypothetical protein
MTTVATQTPPPPSPCVHFFEIESPNGPTSEGVCRKCGETKEFPNSVKESGWNEGAGYHNGHTKGQLRDDHPAELLRLVGYAQNAGGWY